MKKYILLLFVCCWSIISCANQSSNKKNTFSLNIEEVDLEAGVKKLIISPSNLESRHVVLYKIANGEKSIEWFGCQGVSVYPIEESAEVKVTDGIYTIYSLLTDGTEFITTYDVYRKETVEDNLFSIALENCEEIVLSAKVNIEILEEDEIETSILYRDARTLSECINNLYSSEIITDSFPYSYETKENEVITLYIKLKTGVEYIKIIYLSNIDEIPPMIEVKYDKETKNLNNVEIFLDVSSKNGISKILYAVGRKDVSYFNKGGINITENKSFFVDENNVYTIYAEDKYGLSAIRIFEITNIVTNRPKIGISLSELNYTNKNILLVMNVDYLGKDKKIEKYAEGRFDSEWFIENGILYEGPITIKENGIYSFYAENTEGVFSVTDIEITNIDKTNPTLQVINQNNTSSYLKEIIIDVFASDDSGIEEIIIAEGICSVQTILQGYYYELDNYAENKYSYVLRENGTYTIGVKDYADNWTLKTITISNIDNEKPGQIVNLNATYNNGFVVLNWKLPDDRDISNIKIKWIQDMSDNSSMKEILLDGNVTKYEFSVDEENKQCMLFISVIDFAGNESVGVVKTLNW